MKPSSASTDDHNALDRDNPAPITIEAGIRRRPQSKTIMTIGQEDFQPEPRSNT